MKRPGLSRPSLALLGLALVGISCANPQERWNVLLVTFDTTRADHLGAYGHDRARTPTIDALAAEGVMFADAYTTNPLTLPAHASLMTGTYPMYHGVRNNATYFVRDELQTLAETLAAADYETAAFVGAFVLDSQFNLDQGFEHYDDRVERDWSRDEIELRERNAFGFAERKANLVSLAATNWLRERKGGRQPFFMWLHYFDPHEPKNPPEPHRSLLPGPYDAEIAFADEQLGNVIRELEDQGEYDRTLIVLTADHGEGLLDHGEPTHSLLIFDTTMHIPLIFRVPGEPGGRVDDQIASLVDVMPTILDLLDLDGGDAIQGYSLFLPPGERVQRRTIYMESMVGKLQHGWGALRGLRDASHKLIHGPAPRLFKIDEDPGEVFNLATQEPEKLSEMERRLARFLEEHRSSDSSAAVTTADEETIRKLRSLGYMVTQGSTNLEDSLESEGEDPHRLRYLFDLLGVATENVKGGQVLKGLSQMEEVLLVDPNNLAAINQLARTHFQHTGRADKARELLERSLELRADQEDARYYLSRILFAAGDIAGAQEQVEAILEFQPNSIVALYELGRIHSALGDEPATLDHYQQALDLDPTHLPTLMALGVFYSQQRRNEEAGPYFQRARDVEPGNPGVLYNVGIWHLQAGDREAAARTLSQVVAINPVDRDAYFVLGRLLAERGDRLRARPVLERALALNAQRQDRVAEINVLLEDLP